METTLKFNQINLTNDTNFLVDVVNNEIFFTTFRFITNNFKFPITLNLSQYEEYQTIRSNAIYTDKYGFIVINRYSVNSVEESDILIDQLMNSSYIHSNLNILEYANNVVRNINENSSRLKFTKIEEYLAERFLFPENMILVTNQDILGLNTDLPRIMLLDYRIVSKTYLSNILIVDSAYSKRRLKKDIKKMHSGNGSVNTIYTSVAMSNAENYNYHMVKATKNYMHNHNYHQNENYRINNEYINYNNVVSNNLDFRRNVNNQNVNNMMILDELLYNTKNNIMDQKKDNKIHIVDIVPPELRKK